MCQLINIPSVLHPCTVQMYVPKKGYTNFTISKVDIMCLCVCVCAAGMQIFKCVSVCVCNGSGKFGGRDYGSDA